MSKAELTTIQEQQRERFFDYLTEQVGAPRHGVLSASVTDGYVRIGYHDGVGAKGNPKVRYQWYNFTGWGSM